jgi:hypothetical protein
MNGPGQGTSQVMLRDPEMPRVRMAAANAPYPTNTTNVRAMNTPLSSSIRGSASGRLVLTNCGRNAKKKRDSLGLRTLTSTPETMTWRTDRGSDSVSSARPPCSRVCHAM